MMSSQPTPTTETPPQPGHQPQKSGAKNGCLGCLGIIFLFFVVFYIADIAGCQWTQNQYGGSPAAANKPTKAEWLTKLASRYGQYAQMRIIYDWRVSDFKSLMGEPDRTETLGDHAFWYYDCSDGIIQLSMFAPNLAVGVMQGKINDH